LISMPTGTSTIFGVFQVIRELQVRGTGCRINMVRPHRKWRKPASSFLVQAG
jgi:hypothetical protein